MRLLLLIITSIALNYGTATPPPHYHLIVRGKNTTIEDYPYQLSFGDLGKHLCGAALIRPNVALTAAHCTDSRSASSLTIRAGSTILNDGGKLVNVTNICQHPKYANYDYDVSVLLLDQLLELDDSIQTISIRSVGEDVLDGTLGGVTGWGRLYFDGPFPHVLQQVEVPKVSQEICKTHLSDLNITSRMNCYGYAHGGKDACQGDSGGPLVVDGELAGVVSFGELCAEPNIPGVYTNLANKEINDHITNCIENF